MILVSVIGIQSSYGTEPQTTDNYYCGFKTESEFNLWTILRLDNDTEIRSWVYSMYEEQSVVCTCNLDIESNDWLISPMLTLTKGKQHFIKMKLGTRDSDQRIIFTMGRDKTAEAQTEVLLDSVFNNVSGYLTIKIPENASGDYYFGLNYRAGAWSGIFTIYSFYLTETEGVDLCGSVTNDKGTLVANAQVVLSGEKFKESTIETKESGEFSFNNLEPGDYKLKVTADGHIPSEETVSIGTQNKDYPVVITKLSEYNVTGCVKSKEDIPVRSALVTLKGELNYETTTDENGNFLFEKVREYKGYKLKIEKDLKITYTHVIDITENADLGDLVMETFRSKPYNILAQETDAGVLLTWMLPLKADGIRYDSGIHYGTYTISPPTDYAVIGNKFDTPLLLKGMSWMTGGESDAVDIYVFDINKDGSLSNRILYSAKNIKNINYEYDDNYVWNEYNFPEEIEAPYGCVLALASNKSLEVLYDSGNDEGYPNVYKNCMSYDYRDGIAPCSTSGNFFIRLLGSPLGVPKLAPINKCIMKCFKKDAMPSVSKSPASESITYKIWRFESQNKDDMEKWTPIELNDQQSLSYLDRSFKDLSNGAYQYAAQVIYEGGQESELGYSNEIEYKMYTNVSFAVSTDMGAAYADGAVAKLENVDDENIVYITNITDSKAHFKHIKKGSYILTVSKKGFENIVSDEIYLISNENYEFKESFIFKLIANNPFNLKTKQNDDMDVTFSWNVEEGIFEDFENMKDFDVNPGGDTGWTYMDGDGQETVGISLCQNNPYPNMYAKMAFMCFNPSKTNPDLLDYLKPYSGDKILVDVATEEGQNDDYLFSPELSFKTDFVLNFFAKSGFFADGGNEEFMIGYCTEKATPEKITWITTKPQSVGAAWTEFTYDIPKEAKFITIRCVSNQRFFFVLDDIYIGYKRSFADDLANYEVYLDEESVGKTGQSQMTFPRLSKGKHLAKVQSVYTLVGDKKLYSDFVELAFTVNTLSDIDNAVTEDLYIYNQREGIVTFTKSIEVSVYNSQGQLIENSKGSQVSVSDWQSGLYIFKVNTGEQVLNHKIFIK